VRFEVLEAALRTTGLSAGKGEPATSPSRILISGS